MCAVAQLIFSRDVRAVAALFGELMLLPDEALQTAAQREELAAALEAAASRLLDFGDDELADDDGERALPSLRFDALIGELASIAPAFAFELPPYFLNNARAIATLEGMAKSADPSFDVLQVVYPFALRRLLADPRGSPRLRQTLRSLTSGEDGSPSLVKMRALLRDSARLSGTSQLAVALDAARTPGGRAFARDLVGAGGRALVRRVRRRKAVPT